LKPAVALLGDILTDVILQIPGYPPPGGDGIADQMHLRCGGSVTNTAILLARLGLDARLLGKFGRDSWAGHLTEILHREGVDLSKVQIDDETGTGLTVAVVTPNGERTMFTYRGANTTLSPQNIVPGSLSGAGGLHLSGYALLSPPQSEAALAAAGLAAQMKIPVSLDLGVEPALRLGPRLIEQLPGLDLLILGIPELQQVSPAERLETGIEHLLLAGIGRVALKLGENGCRIFTHTEQVSLPGFPVTPVDTTGAGDAFSAGLLFGSLNGLSLSAASLLANSLGALTTTCMGAGEAMPTLPDAIDFIRELTDLTPQQNNWRDEVLNTLLRQTDIEEKKS
jgi:ribokinase